MWAMILNNFVQQEILLHYDLYSLDRIEILNNKLTQRLFYESGYNFQIHYYRWS